MASGAITNATAIGAKALVGASNSMVLGSINGVNSATASTKVGVGTTTPNSSLHVSGSVALHYAIANTGTYALSDTDYTVRRYGGCTNITLPDASTCLGRVYIIISSNGSITNVSLTPLSGQIVYDDVSNITYGSLAPNQRIQIQSDGTNWLVIGN